jgi:flagellar biosynthetic protein FliP
MSRRAIHSVRWVLVLGAVLVSVCAPRSLAQDFMGPPAPDAAEMLSNPVALLESAAAALPGREGAAAPTNLSASLNIIVLLTVLTLVPSIMVMCTCFVRFAIVFALLKQALGAQSIPPSQVITALALFMTFLVMSPTLDRIHAEAIGPYQRGEITDQLEMWNRAKQPLRDFMFAQIEATENWSSLYMVLNYRGVDTSQPERLTRADVDMISLIPAFMLSELKVSFLMGFRVYLPFLIIDMVISSLLISMSMMMLPPVLISLPFKLLMFVLVDGWQLVVGSLMQSVVQPGG